MKNLYVFSGLGADKRVFQKMDFSQFSTTFVEWISPEPNEMMEHYAKRLLCQIKHEKPILLGLSFGGIIATEIGKLIQTEQIILIASAKKSNETPLYYRIAGKLKLHKLVPVSLMKSANIFSYWFFGIEVNSEKKILKQILKDTDEVFLKWAIDKIVTWKNEVEPGDIFHIHGTSDRILPIRFIKCSLKVSNGGHFMTLNKSEELTEIVRNAIFKTL